MSHESEIHKEEAVKNIFSEAARKLQIENFDPNHTLSLLQSVLNAGKILDRFNPYLRTQTLDRLLKSPTEKVPEKNDVGLLFWNWGWDSTSGSGDKMKILPMQVQMGKFSGKVIQIGAGMAQLLDIVDLGYVDANKSTLKVNKSLRKPYNKGVYLNSKVILFLE